MDLAVVKMRRVDGPSEQLGGLLACAAPRGTVCCVREDEPEEGL